VARRKQRQGRPEATAPPGEVFQVADLVGCEVQTETGDVLGVLRDVTPTGANDVFVVMKGEREYLLPALKSVVEHIDLTTRVIRVRMPAGLRELYEGL
jgi:16S rRNA processing protein RimM